MTVDILQTILNSATVVIKFSEPVITNYNYIDNIISIAVQETSENKTILTNEQVRAGDGNVESITFREI